MVQAGLVSAALLAAAVFLIGPASLSAAEIVSGRVVSAASGRPIVGVLITVRGTEAAGGSAVTSDADGRFRLEIPAPSESVLVFRKTGFAEAIVKTASGSGLIIRLTADPSAFLPAEEVVVEAAGLDRTAFELPYAGRTVSRDRLLDGGIEALNEAVADVPGISFVGGGFHSAPSLRGLARNRLVLLVDGVRTASIRTVGGHLGFVHPFAVEDVEVVKGPFSTVYGHDAMAGVLQVDTLRPAFSESGLSIRGGATAGYQSAANGSDGAFHLEAGTRKAAFLVSCGRTVEEDYRMGGGAVLPQSGFRLASFLAKGEFRPAAGHHLEILYLRTDGTDIGKASGDPAIVNRHPSESNEVAALSYEWRPNGPFLNSLEAKLSRGLFSLAADFRTLTGPRTVQSLRDLGEDDYGVFLRAGLSPVQRAIVFIGLDGYFQENQRITGVKNIYLTGQSAPFSSASLNEVPLAATRDVGLFAQGTWAAAPRWDFIFGARMDGASERAEFPDGVQLRRFDPELNGNLGLLYKIGSGLRLGANIGTAFRLPTPKDRYFVGQTPQGINIGNPDLKPEHSLNADLVLKFRTETPGPLWVEGSLAGFVNRFRDLIVIKWDQPTGNRTGVFANAGRAEIYGLEAEAALAWKKGWTVSAAVTALGAAVHGNDEVLDDLPPLQGRLSLRRTLAGTGWLGLDLRGAVAEGRTSAGDLPASAWLTADLAAGWRIGRTWALRLSLDNVFDASYREFFDLPLLRRKGRSLDLSLTVGL
ncbi:MAG: TonB-dependent receptor [Candidatus Aminicenantes bacterium]|nr:TonB-dependent receptor [Candidatus Aminicenantes bacterium]